MRGILGAREQIENAWRTLQNQWRASCEQWNDPVRHRFECEFWEDYECAVPDALRQMNHLAEVTAQARQEVK